MPVYDPTIPSKVQLFLSNYFLETLFYSIFEKGPVVIPLYAKDLSSSIAPFTTDTFECVFPFMTSRFGRNVSTDLIMKIRKIHDLQTKEEGKKGVLSKNGTIEMKLDIDLEAMMLYPEGVNKSAGTVEF